MVQSPLMKKLMLMSFARTAWSLPAQTADCMINAAPIGPPSINATCCIRQYTSRTRSRHCKGGGSRVHAPSKQFVSVVIMCSLKVRMYQNRFRPGFLPGPNWGELMTLPRPTDRLGRGHFRPIPHSMLLAFWEEAPSASSGPKTFKGAKTALKNETRQTRVWLT